jgi:hypothetical protein
LIGSFLLRFTYCDAEKGKATEISYSDARSLVNYFLGFHIVTTGNVFDYDTKEQEHQNTQQSDLYSGGYAPSYKSDSLVF